MARSGFTGSYTFSTQGTSFPGNSEHRVQFAADLLTGAAADAFYLCKQDFLLPVHGFGILAPEAAERAALQEKGGADTGAVVDCITFDVKNFSFHRTPHKKQSRRKTKRLVVSLRLLYAQKRTDEMVVGY